MVEPQSTTPPPPVDHAELREELLEAAAPEPEKVSEAPKKNTKQALFQKILEVSEKSGIPLEYSNSKLRRMNKTQLANVLASIIEEGVRRKMAHQVGCDEHADSRTIALGALRMLHDVAAIGFQTGGNALLQPRGYVIENFSESLKDPSVSHVIDGCLQEIANESPEILQYIESPYSRLALAWAGALTFCVRKKAKENATVLGPVAARSKNSFRGSRGRRPQTGQIDSHTPSPPNNVKQI